MKRFIHKLLYKWFYGKTEREMEVVIEVLSYNSHPWMRGRDIVRASHGRLSFGGIYVTLDAMVDQGLVIMKKKTCGDHETPVSYYRLAPNAHDMIGRGHGF